ncbi:hypothetical protein EIN_170850 [Entamoeba invadens IP1]|uniref:Uncharacterized protein n=1 Tax=Entamoeba invadens IP1 TaxID=370355 RepID=A0A0A1TYC7_ENTIV|nr:hypothetical protein EIN_170850 [Entamoeba invadens IP1]ELP84550.1 hypothetical protein EIN_170850 [Entamoeba invadens IP1]|eukprot:XP_004183896.1 hypothetical protein EIN_170850 [Entamoeba invadens IP1]
MENINDLIQKAFGNASVSPTVKNQSMAYLTEFLKKPEAFNYFQPLMTTPSTDPLQLIKVNYGSMILQKKLMYNFSQIQPQVLQQINEFVFQKIFEFQKSQLIVKQLSLAIVAFTLHDQSWGNFIDTIVNKIPNTSQNAELLTSVFLEIASAAEKMDLVDSSMRAKFIQIIAQATPSVLDFVVSMNSQNSISFRLASECLSSWVKNSGVEITYYRNSQVLPFLLRQLQTQNGEAASTVLDDFLFKMMQTNKECQGQKDAILNITVLILQEFVKYVDVIQKIPYSCFFTISQLISMDAYTYIKSQYSQTLSAYLNLLVVASNVVEENTIHDVSEAAISLLETPSSKRAQESKELYEFFMPFAKAMLEKVVTLHMDCKNLEGEDLEDFLHFRETSTFYLVRKCVDTIGSTSSVNMLVYLWENVTNKEVILASLEAAYEDLSIVSSQQLINLFSYSIQLVNQNTNVPKQFIKTLIVTIGDYARYFGENFPNVIESCVTFLMKYVGAPGFGEKAAKALRNLAEESGEKIGSYQSLQQMFQNVVDTILQGKLKGNEVQFEDIIIAFCMSLGGNQGAVEQLFIKVVNVLNETSNTLTDSTINALWILETIFIGLKKSKHHNEIGMMIVNFQIPQLLHNVIQNGVQRKANKVYEKGCATLGVMYEVTRRNSSQFFGQTTSLLTQGYVLTKNGFFIFSLSKIIDALFEFDEFKQPLKEQCLPLIMEAMKNCTIDANDVIIDITDCIFGIAKTNVPDNFVESAMNWLVSFLKVADRSAYRGICDQLVDFIMQNRVNKYIEQPTVILSIMESVVSLYSKDRVDNASFVLRLIYNKNPGVFCQNMQLIFSNKYQVPDGFKQSLLPTNQKYTKEQIKKILSDLFFILKETA